MSSVQPPLESASRAGRLDRILRDLLQQTPGVDAAAVVSFDGLPMASALPPDMDEDRVAAMSAALLSLAERAAQGLGRGDLSQVYIEGEHGTVFLVSAQDEGVLIAVTAAGAKVGMMLYEVKLAANRVGEVLHGPVPLPTPLPARVTRVDERRAEDHRFEPAAAPDPVTPALPTVAEVAASYTGQAHPEQPASSEPVYAEPMYSEPMYSESPLTDPAFADPAYPRPTYAGPAYVAYVARAADEPRGAEPSSSSAPEMSAATANAEPANWSSYAPNASVLPGERNSWS
jgi:uncharacterized protein